MCSIQFLLFQKTSAAWHTVVGNALHLLEEISIVENSSLPQEARDKLLDIIDMAPADTVKSLSLRNGKKNMGTTFSFPGKVLQLVVVEFIWDKRSCVRKRDRFCTPARVKC